MKLNEKLKELRVSNNMSQEQLAERLYVTRQTVSKWEQGVNQPDIYTLKQYSTIFGVSMDELISDDTQFVSRKDKRLKASKVLFLLSTLFCIFSMILVFILWRFLKDTIPMHWDLTGNIDRYAGKAEILIHLAALAVVYAVALITYLIGKKNIGSALPNLYTTSFIVTFATVLAAQIVYVVFMLCLTANYLITDELMQFIYCIAGDLILVVAVASHPKITHQNTVLGFRTNFTLSNPVAWEKTNKVSSVCMFVAALLMIAVNMIFTQLWVSLVSPIILLVAAAIVYVYEEILKDKMQKEN